MSQTDSHPRSPSTVLAILADAVRLAEQRRIRTVAELREDLLDIHPDQDAEIHAALMLWARHEAAKRLH